MNRRTVAIAVSLVLIFVLSRLVFLIWSEYIYDEEEAKTGSISVILMQDKKLPLMEHQPGDYEGGTLLFGILAIPFMWLFGKPYLGLKLMALTTSLLMALFSTLWIRKIAGNVAAVFSALLYIFAVPYLLQVALIPWGNYAETAMISAIVFFLLHTILFESKQDYLRYCLLGFLCGLGVWVHYGFLVTALVAALMVYLSGWRRLFSKRSMAALAFTAIGFSPWFFYNVSHHFWGLERFSEGLNPAQEHGKVFRIGQRLYALFTQDLPVSLHLIVDGLTLTKILSYLFYFAFVALLIALLLLKRKNICAFFAQMIPGRQTATQASKLAVLVPVIYFFAYAFVYSLTEYGLFATHWGGRDPENHVHIFVMLPAMIWIAAAGAGILWRKCPVAAIAPVSLMIALGMVGQWQMLDFSKSQTWRLDSDFSGEKKVIYMEIGSKWGRIPEEMDRIGKKLNGVDLRSFYFGAGIKFGLDHLSNLQVAIDKCALLEDRYLPYCWFGVGAGLECTGQLTPEGFDEILSGAPEAVKPFLIAGDAVAAIWYGKMDHPSLTRVEDIDFSGIAPKGEKEQLPMFIKGHLDIVNFRPKKE